MAIAIYNPWVMQVTGTTTATSLKDLMNTASAWKGDAAFAAWVSYIVLNPEWTIRYTVDWQTPTSSVGMKGIADWNYEIESTLDKIIIINAQKVNITTWFKSLQ